MEDFGSLLLLLALYMAPSFIAGLRQQKNVLAILALNMLLGWTVLGWIVALIWSLTDNTESASS